MYECLGFKGEKDDILVSHCLFLARYHIYWCKFKNISPSIREYAQQLRYNLEIKKQISIVTDSRINFSRSGTKCFMHYNCLIVCGRALNVNLLAGYTLRSPYSDLKPLKIKLAKRCTSGFHSSFYFYLPPLTFKPFCFSIFFA